MGLNLAAPQSFCQLRLCRSYVSWPHADFSPRYHTIGSCSMSEVVDDKLKVKGVENLRVIDASVFPGHVSGNIVSESLGAHSSQARPCGLLSELFADSTSR